jgi:hypothetical protein
MESGLYKAREQAAKGLAACSLALRVQDVKAYTEHELLLLSHNL